MGHASPPPGYVGLAEAAEITGYSTETVRLAAVRGELKGTQRVKSSSWFFLPRDLYAWRGIEHPVDFESIAQPA